jgi:hypothetical protein
MSPQRKRRDRRQSHRSSVPLEGLADARDGPRALHPAIPAPGKLGFYPELVDHARYDVIDDIIKVLRMIIERRDRGQNGDAHARKRQTVFWRS